MAARPGKGVNRPSRRNEIGDFRFIDHNGSTNEADNTTDGSYDCHDQPAFGETEWDRLFECNGDRF